MKFKIEKLDKEILKRLQGQGILLSKNARQLSKDKALVLIGEAMLDKMVKEMNEFVSLWKELFLNCRLQDFEASEEEKKILGRQDPAENGNSKTTGQDNNDLCKQEMQTEAGIEYWDMPTLGRKTVKAEHQSISGLWRNSYVPYQPGEKNTSNYKQEKRQQFLPRYAKHYQLPKQLKSCSYGRIRLPSLYKSFGALAKNIRNSSPFTQMPRLYHRQIGSKSVELGTGSYKSLESYLNDYKEVV